MELALACGCCCFDLFKIGSKIAAEWIVRTMNSRDSRIATRLFPPKSAPFSILLLALYSTQAVHGVPFVILNTYIDG